MNAPFPAETASTAKPIADKAVTDIDARLAFLLRSAVRYELLVQDEVDLAEAFDDLVDDFLWIVFPLPENPAQAYWDNPGWAEAAREYHEDSKRGRQ